MAMQYSITDTFKYNSCNITQRMLVSDMFSQLSNQINYKEHIYAIVVAHIHIVYIILLLIITWFDTYCDKIWYCYDIQSHELIIKQVMISLAGGIHL